MIISNWPGYSKCFIGICLYGFLIDGLCGLVTDGVNFLPPLPLFSPPRPLPQPCLFKINPCSFQKEQVIFCYAQISL